MWKFKPFIHKEQTGLEGRTIDVGNLKIQVRNAIAEGGFSCVYLARDIMDGSKQYALKHMICNDVESLDLVMKEIQVMKLLRGHPNVVTLYSHSIVDMGRTKEAFLVLEYCEKSLVFVLENRGAGYYEEKQVLIIFRDVCNAVFAMHCHSPPIAHRDLKAENLLLGSNGLWKLCDFGSTSTNHKRFEKPEEMGIEEDNIRKHTTPAYRAPEMWDLFRREVISEKVDIWALGCLLYRICYFKPAFDGESKLQVLNGNYRLPDMPKYSSSITDLIRDMLEASPEGRPDILQVWFRANELLPVEMQKSLPDRPPEMQEFSTYILEGTQVTSERLSSMPRRSPPPPPRSQSQSQVTSRVGGAGSSLGAFWSTQHAKDSAVVIEKVGPKLDEPSSKSLVRPNKLHLENTSSPNEEKNSQIHPLRKTGKPRSRPEDNLSVDFEIKFCQPDPVNGVERSRTAKAEGTKDFHNEAFNTFVAEFDTSIHNSQSSSKHVNEEELEGEIEKLKQQLKQANLEKAELASKYEKLSAICRSQRQDLQELKHALNAKVLSSDKDASTTQKSVKEKIVGNASKSQATSDSNVCSLDPMMWHAFADNPKSQQPSNDNTGKSVRTRNVPQSKTACEGTFGTTATWGFGTENFTAVTANRPQTSGPIGGVNNSQHFGETNTKSKQAAQPAGWAGF